MAVSIEEATLVSLFCECILYGLFLSLFALSIAIILGRHRKNPSTRVINLKLLCVSVFMFIFATIHVGTGLYRVLHAFVNKHSDDPEATSLELSAINTSAYLVKVSVYTFQTLLGDTFMIYRMYMVWQGNRLVCAPATVTLLGGIACAIGAVHASARAPTFAIAPIFRAGESNWILSWLSLTLFTNGYATACIAGRIWWIRRKTWSVQHKINDMPNTVGSSRLGQPAVIIIESGAIYSISLILILILYKLRTYAQNVVFDCMVHIVGIVFTLIIVRVALGVAGGVPSSRNSNTQQIRFSTDPRSQSDHALSQGGDQFLAVVVLKEEETRYDKSSPDIQLHDRNSALDSSAVSL